MSDTNALIAYEIHHDINTLLEPAPIARDWMDAAPQRHPYRCLPLVIANQAGWVLRIAGGVPRVLVRRAARRKMWRSSSTARPTTAS